MTRYNDEPPMTPEYAAEVFGYREGVERVMWFLRDWDDEGQLIRDIQGALRDGII